MKNEDKMNSLIVRDGQCPCESGATFAACHGATDGTAPPPNKWAAEDLGKFVDLDTLTRFHEPGCAHDKVYSDHILTSNPPKYPWICRKCKARGNDIGAGTGPCGEYEKILRGASTD